MTLTTTLVLVLALYCTIGTALYLRDRRRQSSLSGLEEGLRKRASDLLTKEATDTSAAQLKSLAEAIVAMREQPPWYERSLSSIGVVAFISMSIATASQTISAASSKQAVETLSAQKESLQESNRRAERSIAKAAKHFRADAQPFPEWARPVLRDRILALRAVEEPSQEQREEAFELSLRMGDYANVSDLLQQFPELREGLTSAHRLALAEYHFVSGEENAARRSMALVDEQTQHLGPGPRVRFLALQSALVSSMADEAVAEVSKLQQLEMLAARDLLSKKVHELRQNRERWNSGKCEAEDRAP